MKSTREKILRTLLAFPGSTINDLADSVGINGISVRHHLTALEAEDMVISEEERHGVGRPRLIYTLTEKGVEQFPTSYLRLTKRLLTVLKEKLEPEEVRQICKDIGQDIASKYKNDLLGKSMDEKVKLLAGILKKEGFVIEWSKNADAYKITSFSCPYYKVGLDHPEICEIDHTLISTILSSNIEIKACILAESDRCVYQIPFDQEKVSND